MLCDALNGNNGRGAGASAEDRPAPLLVRRMLFTISLIGAATLGMLLLSGAAFAQDVEAYKRGVVRIHNTRLNVTGTGFIVRLDKDRVYIVTAAHVVRSNEYPNVYFFNRAHDPIQAKLINREDNDDLKGLAFLRVQASAEVLKGVMPLLLSNSSVKGGEAVSIIGFPDGTDKWSVTRATISRLEGREMVFAGPVRTGNSGGPVLLDGQVIGMVTDTIQELGYASQSANIVIYIRGIDAETASSIKLSAGEVGTGTDTPDRSQFCQALSQVVAASHENFYSIVKGGSRGGNLYESSINLPGMSSGYIYPEAGSASFTTGKDEYYTLVTKLKQCLRNWKQEELLEEKPVLEKWRSTVASQSKEYLFTNRDKGVVVKVSMITYGANATRTSIYVYSPNSILSPKRSQVSNLDSAESILTFLSDQEKVEELCQAIRKISDAGQDGFFSVVGKPAFLRGRFALTFEIPGFTNGTVRPRDRVDFIITSSEAKEIENIYYRLVAAVKPCLQDWRPKEIHDQLADQKAGFNSFSYQFSDVEKGSVVEIRTSRFGVYLTVYSPSSSGKPR